jgi:voltage-dependent calcium channel
MIQNLHKREATSISGKTMHCPPFSFSSRMLICANLWHHTHCCFHSIECFARISVSGLILDPEVPATSIFTSPFKLSEDEPIRTGAAPGLAYTPTLNRSGISRTRTLGHRLRRIGNNLFKPFELHHKSTANSTNSGAAAAARTRSGTETRTPMMEKTMFATHEALREPKHIFSKNFFHSDKSDTVSLPFKLFIEQSHQSTRRNMPYLRQSWNRIDFLSILCFWISFGLATGGVEKSSTLYIGIFRALSVLKVSRLLAVTSGTTVGALQPYLALILNSVFRP